MLSLTTKNLVLAAAVAAVATLSTVPTASAWGLGSNGNVLWDNDCDFPGNDIGDVPLAVDKCGDYCVSNPTCTHWTWTASRGCILKGDWTSSKRSSPGAGCGYVIGRYCPYA